MGQRKLKELIDTSDPGIEILKQLVSDAEVPCELLPPGQRGVDHAAMLTAGEV